MSDNNTGVEYISSIFKDAEDSLDGISTIQRENKVRISSMQPALPMLDLNGVTRADIHTSLFTAMQDKLLHRVDSLENKGLTKLLDRCFRYIGAEEQLRSVCLCIMEKLPTVDTKYLSHISDNHDLYVACPLEVKRQIWQSNQGLFGEAVSPLLDQYVAEKESILCFTLGGGGGGGGGEVIPPSFLSFLPKTRRRAPVIKELVEMIGTSQALYSTLLQFLRTLFLRTQIPHYCTLRADLLMTLHDNESPICASDRCHKFAWCLDACIRAGQVDEKKGRELYSFLETLVDGDEILADVAILLLDPYAYYTLGKSILVCLSALAEASDLPRNSTELECLVRLLQIGQKALTFIETKDYYEDHFDVEMMVKFFPDIMSMKVENTIRGVMRRLKEDHTPSPPPTHFTQFISKHAGGMHLACCYVLELLEKKDMRGFTLTLPSLANAFIKSETTTFSDLFLHLLVLGLSAQKESIKEPALLLILRDFWVPCCHSSEHILLFLFRMLWFLHTRISKSLLREVLETIEPGKESSSTAHEQYQTLLDHIQTSSDIH